MILKKHKKTIGVVLAILIAFGTFAYQFNKIHTLKEELYNKQQVEVRLDKTEHTETKMFKKSIREKFNEVKSYKVLDGKVNLKHTYEYEDDAILGMKKRVTISGFCDVYFDYNVDLSTAEIHETENKITIKIDEPTLNKDSLHAIKDSYKQINSSTKYGVLANKEDVRTAMEYYYASLEERASDKITTLYNEEKANHLEYNAKKQVKKLVKTFVDKKVIVEYK